MIQAGLSMILGNCIGILICMIALEGPISIYTGLPGFIGIALLIIGYVRRYILGRTKINP